MKLFFQVASAATSTKVNNAKSFESKIKIVRPKSRTKSPSEKPPKLPQQKAKDILRDLEEHRDTLTDPESFSILDEATSVSSIKLEFELPEDVGVSFDKQAKAQIIIVDVSLPAKKEILWNHFNRKTQQMNNENKKLVAILDKATRNGWTCSLKTSKQCNQGNTLIMLMTTKLYNRVTAEADA